MSEVGLRERKRLATRRAIQHAAITLTGEHGFDAVTVDDIARRADISPRTFFNYFSSKEDAFVGETPSLHDPDAVEEFVAARGDIVDDLVALLRRSLDASAEDHEIMHLRRPVMRRHPQLFARRMASMWKFEDELVSVLDRRLAGERPDLDAGERARRSRLVMLVVLAAVRHAWGLWADGDGQPSLQERLTESIVEIRELLAEGATRS
ncbi:AcrR family transcriptional regulator [Diaminobutyricimonas aerilata]|uniref:AcrR family transcriptional regulator n=1 Tax=Diaminobutyricimonas aerilata TaxID=1162967 RepID=A0A2M9CGT7_9MICO|nr:TetR/AcrR family transcriptional regulator [Diaminobutyricimonas aerilata]PJJ71134.1 AcrR family transcriptional regulator [Diaminobutyricimonas aerilata]